MKTRYSPTGRQRPHYLIKRWVELGSDKALPAPTVPTLEAATEKPKDEPLPGMKVVEEPTLSEQMGGDKVPFDDSPDINAPPPTIDEKELGSHLRKSVEPEPQKRVTRRGV